MPGVPNGTACQVDEELHAEHHGPELQRTGKYVLLLPNVLHFLILSTATSYV